MPSSNVSEVPQPSSRIPAQAHTAPTDQPVPRDLGELAAEICSTAAGIAAATRRWLELMAEFDRHEGWACPGLKSCAHWLSWKCGLSPVAAREHVRVARALTGLPLKAAALRTGRVSYSCVRALTRVADPTTESGLLDKGLAGTVAHVERIVRGWRRAERLNDPEPDSRRFEVQVHWDNDGSLRVAGRLCAEDGALLLAAIEAAQERLDRDRPAPGRPCMKRAGTIRYHPRRTRPRRTQPSRQRTTRPRRERLWLGGSTSTLCPGRVPAPSWRPWS